MCVCVYIYIYIYTHSWHRKYETSWSLSSYHGVSKNSFVPIGHHSRKVFPTEVINRIFGRCNTGVFMCRSPQENFVYEFVLILSTVPSMSCFILLWWFLWWEVSGPYNSSFGGFCFHGLFKTVYCILVLFPSSFFSPGVRVQVVQPCGCTDTPWKNLHFALSVRSDFHMTIIFFNNSPA